MGTRAPPARDMRPRSVGYASPGAGRGARAGRARPLRRPLSPAGAVLSRGGGGGIRRWSKSSGGARNLRILLFDWTASWDGVPTSFCERTPGHSGRVGGLSTAGDRGGGSIEPPGEPPPPRKKGSLDGPPKILPRLTPGPRRWPGPEIRQKNENGIFGISASRGFRKFIICHAFGGGGGGGLDHSQ